MLEQLTLILRHFVSSASGLATLPDKGKGDHDFYLYLH